MAALKNVGIHFIKLIIFWILLFDFQRILFSIHNWEKLHDVSWTDWLLTFVYSFRLDLATAGYLSLLPALILAIRFFYPAKWNKVLFWVVVLIEALFVSLIHPGEINAYVEWNHKLTSRVFMHLSNPDEVFRTADYSMTIWYTIYAILEFVFAIRLLQWLFKMKPVENTLKWFIRVPAALIVLGLSVGFSFLMMRGGWQQIPININSSYFSNSHVANDLCANSFYYFCNSYIIYNNADIDQYMPDIKIAEAKEIVDSWDDYPKEHDVRIFDTLRPNVVVIVLESWAAEAIGGMSETKGATPFFDKMIDNGLLFNKVYATAATSEIGNSSIFSGNPAIPGISISIQPEKHRKMHSINEEFQDWGYSTHYIFSGDLKYGNIGGYFMDHGFQDVKDENDFPSGLERGKLNYYDEALYELLIDRINNTDGQFLHCAFTGSTHSPYDYPKSEKQNWDGPEADFMNSVIYADECIKNFIADAKKQDWYDNTIFIFVADHGHSTPSAPVPYSSAFYRIPFLMYGEPLKDEFKGKKIEKLGSQADIAATLMYQLNGDISRYPWSKDLLNPQSPEYAFHTIIDGYGWISPKGHFSYQMKHNHYVEKEFAPEDEAAEIRKAHAYLRVIYNAYKEL